MTENPTVFIGSSSESLRVARAFQIELERATRCEVDVWDQGTFVPGQYTMTALRDRTLAVDFAVMVMTPDDVVETRGLVGQSPRDNVLFELGLFMGALGVERVFMLTPRVKDLKIPSDLNGITRLSPYDPERSNVRAALAAAVADADQAIVRLGRRTPIGPEASTAHPSARPSTSDLASPQQALASDLAVVRRNAEAQGWRILRANSETTFRLLSPKGRKFSFAIPEDPTVARSELRGFARELRAAGLRVNQRVRRPVG